MTSRRRIAVLGPLPPTRGGIARHTALTAQALREEATVKVWSFKRQYPRFVYPGQSEYSNEAANFSDLEERRIVDGINPLTWVETAKEISAWKPDLLVFPMWTFFLAPSLGWIARTLRHKGFETCAIVHNAHDHEKALWKEKLSLWGLGQADRFVTHGAELAKQISSRFPSSKVDIFPHPIFDDYPLPKHKLQREYALELLFYGVVRPYKGLDVALHALALSGRKDVRLTIAGEFWQGLAETRELIRSLGISDQVVLRPEYISDVETAELFDRTDAVVLPYRSVTSSGILAMALFYQRPVIVSDHAALSTLVEQFDAGWIFPTEQPKALADIMVSLNRNMTKTAGSNAKVSAETLTWENFAATVVGKYAKN